jgi:hypothetical protein
MTSRMLTDSEIAALDAASALLRAPHDRARSMRDVVALVERGVSVADAIAVCIGIVSAMKGVNNA